MIFGKRGFVTIATGQERYYRLARNLLRSYKLFAVQPCPFAIIADRENSYTAEFDHVVLLKDPCNNYNDKLKLFRELPYEETIFIDADSLAYGDLNAWWDIFSEAGDFSLFGYAWRDLQCGRGWFVPAGMGEYQRSIQFIPDFNGGVYYLRDTPNCKRVFDIANAAVVRYHDYQFKGFQNPADEPVLALGMAVCAMEPVNRDQEMIFAPSHKKIHANIAIPQAIYDKNSDYSYHVRLIHFSNYHTQLALYKNEVIRMEMSRQGKQESPLKGKCRYMIMRCGNIIPFCGRIHRKIRRILHK